jgi:hypothetical protein
MDTTEPGQGAPTGSRTLNYGYGTFKTKNTHKIDIFASIFTSVNPFRLELVNLTTTQVETLFGELEYIEPRLKALGVAMADEEVDHV